MDEVTIKVNCSRTGRLMRVHFARPAPDAYYEVERVLPGSGVTATIAGRRGRSDASTVVRVEQGAGASLEASEFDWSDFACIHCGEGWALTPIIKCGGCGLLLCSGTLKPKRRGGFTVSCSMCGSKGTLGRGGPIESYDVQRGSGTVPELSAGGRGLLGQAKRLLGRGGGES